jgi:hypothetical protein
VSQGKFVIVNWLSIKLYFFVNATLY